MQYNDNLFLFRGLDIVHPDMRYTHIVAAWLSFLGSTNVYAFEIVRQGLHTGICSYALKSFPHLITPGYHHPTFLNHLFNGDIYY